MSRTMSESGCDETPAAMAATYEDSDAYVRLPKRLVERMTEMCCLFVMTAAQLVQPASTDNHVSFPTLCMLLTNVEL